MRADPIPAWAITRSASSIASRSSSAGTWLCPLTPSPVRSVAPTCQRDRAAVGGARPRAATGTSVRRRAEAVAGHGPQRRPRPCAARTPGRGGPAPGCPPRSRRTATRNTPPPRGLRRVLGERTSCGIRPTMQRVRLGRHRTSPHYSMCWSRGTPNRAAAMKGKAMPETRRPRPGTHEPNNPGGAQAGYCFGGGRQIPGLDVTDVVDLLAAKKRPGLVTVEGGASPSAECRPEKCPPPQRSRWPPVEATRRVGPRPSPVRPGPSRPGIARRRAGPPRGNVGTRPWGHRRR